MKKFGLKSLVHVGCFLGDLLHCKLQMSDFFQKTFKTIPASSNSGAV